jgi:hypothetical protein
LVRKLFIEAMQSLKNAQELNDEIEINMSLSMVMVLKEREAALTKANGIVVFD